MIVPQLQDTATGILCHRLHVQDTGTVILL